MNNVQMGMNRENPPNIPQQYQWPGYINPYMYPGMTNDPYGYAPRPYMMPQHFTELPQSTENADKKRERSRGRSSGKSKSSSSKNSK